MTDSKIKAIISAIDVLISGQERDVKLHEESGRIVTELLQHRLICFAQKVSTDAELSAILSDRAPNLLRPPSSDNNPVCLFVHHCLSLLVVLVDLLDNATNASSGEPHAAPVNCLGVQQLKSLRGLLQFVVALGVNPNLLPGVGLALERRTARGALEWCVTSPLLPWQKHRLLVASVRALLACARSPALGSVVLHHHLVDLLAALMQLCHAPIRKISQDVECSEFGTDFVNHLSTTHELSLSLVKCRDAAPPDDRHLMKEMLQDRHKLSVDLCHLLETTYQPLIVRELLLLLSNSFQLKTKNASQVKKTPQWLRNICGQFLTECLLRKGGLAQVTLGIFDAWSVDSSGGLVAEKDWQKCEAFAKIIARAPGAKGVSVESYYERMAPQVAELLCRTHASNADKLVFRVACAILGAMLEEQPQHTSCLVLRNILRPLFSCTRQQGAASSDDIIASEEDIASCIELTHKIVSSVGPGHPVLDALVPVFPVIFEIAVCAENTVSYLRQPCEEILSAVYHSQPSGSSLELLHWCLFNTRSQNPLATVRQDAAFVLGSSGGVQVVHRISPLSDEEWLTHSDKAFLATASIFQQGRLHESCGEFFMSLLKKLTEAVESLVSPETGDSTMSPTLQFEVKSQKLRDNLFLLHLVENFAELTSDALAKNTRSLLEFVVETLSRVTKLSKDSEANSLALQSTLFCLTLISLLTSSEGLAETTNRELWQQCNQCLMTLASSHSVSEIRNMAHQLQLSVASQGAVASPHLKANAGTTATANPQVKTGRLSAIAAGLNIFPVEDGVSVEEGTVASGHPKANAGPRARANPRAKTGQLSAIATGLNIVPVTDGVNVKGATATELTQEQQQQGSVDEEDSVDVKPVVLPNGTKFGQLWCDLHDPAVPVRGHAFIQLRRLLQEGHVEVWEHQDRLLETCDVGVQDEDSYVYLSAIGALAILVEREPDRLLPWLAERLLSESEKLTLEARLNLGEVFVRVTKNFGDMAPKYRNVLVNSFLAAAKHPDPVLRSSAVSNLGELCGKLGYSFRPITQEILSCLRGLMRDPADIVRHAAVLALGCIIKGMGQQIFQVMPHEVKQIYQDLKHLYATTSDSVTRIQAQVAIDELSTATQELLRSQSRMEKRIQILDLQHSSGSEH